MFRRNKGPRPTVIIEKDLAKARKRLTDATERMRKWSRQRIPPKAAEALTAQRLVVEAARAEVQDLEDELVEAEAR